MELEANFEGEMRNATEGAEYRRPLPDDWGFEAESQIDPWTSLGPVFKWFATRDELLEFLRRYLIAESGFIDRLGDEKFLASFSAALEPFAKGAPFKAMSDALNPLLEGVYVFTWAGQFRDLIEGDSEYARSIRAEFRDHQRDDEGDEGADDTPLREDDFDEFIDFITWARRGI